MHIPTIQRDSLFVFSFCSFGVNNPTIRRITSIAKTAFEFLAVASVTALIFFEIPLWVPLVLITSCFVVAFINSQQRLRSYNNTLAHKVTGPTEKEISALIVKTAFPFATFDQFFNHLRAKNPEINSCIYPTEWSCWKSAISTYLKDAHLEDRWDLIVSNSGLNLLHYLLLNLVHLQITNDEAISFLISKGLAKLQSNYGETPLQMMITVLQENRHLWAEYYKEGEIPPVERNYNSVILQLLVEAKKNGEDMVLISERLPAEFKHLLDSKELQKL